MKRFWRSMAAFRGVLGVVPNASWRRRAAAVGFPDSPRTTWTAAELTRGSAKDIAEAGRELGRYDGRPWLSTLKVPAAVVVTSATPPVPVYKQRELAELLDARRLRGARRPRVGRGRARALQCAPAGGARARGREDAGGGGVSDTFAIGGDLPVDRLGFGAMRITGPGIWGEPADRDEAPRGAAPGASSSAST